MSRVLEFDLVVEVLPLPAERTAAWEAAMQALAELIVTAAMAAEEQPDGETVEPAHAAA